MNSSRFRRQPSAAQCVPPSNSTGDHPSLPAAAGELTALVRADQHAGRSLALPHGGNKPAGPSRRSLSAGWTNPRPVVSSNHGRQEQPAVAGPDAGDGGDPDLVGCAGVRAATSTIMSPHSTTCLVASALNSFVYCLPLIHNSAFAWIRSVVVQGRPAGPCQDKAAATSESRLPPALRSISRALMPNACGPSKSARLLLSPTESISRRRLRTASQQAR